MIEKERQSLEKAVTALVEGIEKWQFKTGVITLHFSDETCTFKAMPECEASGIVVATFDLGWLEDFAGITENCSEEDKKTGIALICDSIEQSLKDGDFDQKIDESFAD